MTPDAEIGGPRVDSAITLRDGRSLAYAEWGDEAGRPVVFFHGAMCSRLLCPDESATRRAGVRLITVDRPGYGRSDPRPGMTLLDWVDDYAQLCDLLQLPPCPIVAWSSGGPWALACAARLRERVLSIGLAASVGPLDEVPNLWQEVPPAVRDLIERLREDRPATSADVAGYFAWYAIEPTRGPRLPPDHPDVLVFKEPKLAAARARWRQEGARQGTTGVIDCWIAESLPWGFGVAEIQAKTHIWWGDQDTIIFRSEAEYLARTIHRATLTVYRGEGHAIPFTHWAAMLAAVR